MMLQRKHFVSESFLIASIVLWLTVGTGGAARVEVPDPSIMLPLVPAAAQAQAPPIIKPGTRLTYFGMTASLPGEYGKLTQDGACGRASIGGLWIAPSALAGLRPQQVIERNDLVGTTVTVSEVGPGSVTLSEIGPLHRNDWTYDTRTGVLSATRLVQQIGLAQITHSLRLVGQP